MLESQRSRSNLDQDWLRGMEIVSEGMLESQQSRSNLDQNWLRGMGIVSRRYAGNTTSSVKPGSRLAERYMRIVSVCMNRSSVGQIWIQTG